MIEIGRIDLLRKKSLFYNPSGSSTVYKKDIINPFLRLTLEIFFAQKECFFVHACAIKKDGQGFVFIGPSRSGKTTIAHLLCDWKVLSDDFVCLRNKNGISYVYATPWRSYSYDFAPVEKMFFLKKSSVVEFKRLDAKLALFKISPHTFLNFPYQEITDKIIQGAASVIEGVPCYNMRFSLNRGAVKKGLRSLN